MNNPDTLSKAQRAQILFESVMNRYDWRCNYGSGNPLRWRMHLHDGTDTGYWAFKEADGTFRFGFAAPGGYPMQSCWCFLSHQEAIIQCAKAYEAENLV